MSQHLIGVGLVLGKVDGVAGISGPVKVRPVAPDLIPGGGGGFFPAELGEKGFPGMAHRHLGRFRFSLSQQSPSLEVVIQGGAVGAVEISPDGVHPEMVVLGQGIFPGRAVQPGNAYRVAVHPVAVRPIDPIPNQTVIGLVGGRLGLVNLGLGGEGHPVGLYGTAVLGGDADVVGIVSGGPAQGVVQIAGAFPVQAGQNHVLPFRGNAVDLNGLGLLLPVPVEDAGAVHGHPADGQQIPAAQHLAQRRIHIDQV